jgi:hypothetical protein
MRICSLVVTAYLFILQIPLFTVLFQGYLCDETGDVSLGITCASSLHSILILTSTLMLVVYIVFLVSQTLLFASNSFEIVVPWASFERELAMIRQLIKFVIAVSLALDKNNTIRGEVNLALAALYAYICIRRCKDALIFDTSVFFAFLFYEVLSFWLYLVISLHQLTNTTLTITSVSLIFLAGCFFSGLLITYQSLKMFNDVTAKDTAKQFTRAMDYMIYVYRMHKVIEGDAPEKSLVLEGKLMQHMNHCEREDCPCSMVMEQLDDIQIQKDIMQRDEDLQRDEEKSMSRIYDGAPSVSDMMIDQSTG